MILNDIHDVIRELRFYDEDKVKPTRADFNLMGDIIYRFFDDIHQGVLDSREQVLHSFIKARFPDTFCNCEFPKLSAGKSVCNSCMHLIKERL